MMYGYGPYGMAGYGSGYHAWGPMMFFGGFFGFAVLFLVIAAVVWGTRSMGHGYHHAPPQLERSSRGLAILDERYASGEINRDEYLQRKKDILEGRS